MTFPGNFGLVSSFQLAYLSKIWPISFHSQVDRPQLVVVAVDIHLRASKAAKWLQAILGHRVHELLRYGEALKLKKISGDYMANDRELIGCSIAMLLV